VPTIAFVREPGAALDRCELTHLPRVSIDGGVARAQHSHYVSTLSEMGARIEWLTPLPEHADGVFVEDTAVILPEVAVIARPGVASRQGEVESVAASFAMHRPISRITAPAALDGGDVLCIGRRILVGVSTRTNEAGVSQLQTAVREFNYEVRTVRVNGCLHLKSACTAISPDIVIANLQYIEREVLGDVTVIGVDANEPRAANTLTLGGVTLVSASHPCTEENLRKAGLRTRSIDVSELEKAEAGLTCMSLVLSTS
jgi:dimethylargininase